MLEGRRVPWQLCWVFLGGALGTVARWAVGLSLSAPQATFLVNITGALVLGFLTSLLADRSGERADGFKVFACTGFMGAWTSYSTFVLIVLAEGVALYAVAMVAAGIGAAFVGLWLGQKAAA